MGMKNAKSSKSASAYRVSLQPQKQQIILDLINSKFYQQYFVEGKDRDQIFNSNDVFMPDEIQHLQSIHVTISNKNQIAHLCKNTIQEILSEVLNLGSTQQENQNQINVEFGGNLQTEMNKVSQIGGNMSQIEKVTKQMEHLLKLVKLRGELFSLQNNAHNIYQNY